MKNVKKMSSHDVYLALRDKIIHSDIIPGESVKEVELATEFGISRTPIREALKKLESRGLLSYEKNRGMIVPVLDNQSIAELFVIREMLEGTAAALAAKYATDEEICILKDMIIDDTNRLDNPSMLARTNKLFHHTINQIAHNSYLIQFYSLLDESMSLLGKTTLSDPQRVEKTLAQHRSIVDAIEKRNPELAKTCAKEHAKSAYRARLRVLLDIEMHK